MDTELAYLSGVLDCDGCFTTTEVDGHAYPLVVLAQVTEGIPALLARRYGGKANRNAVSCVNGRDTYTWKVAGSRTEEVLGEVTPLLRNKRGRAELLAEMAGASASVRYGLHRRVRAACGAVDVVDPIPVGALAEEELRAYLAGAMDADGTFQIAHPRPPRAGQAHVSFTKSWPQIPRLLGRTFGGKVTKRPPGKGGVRATYRWYCPASSMSELLRALLPHLRLKAEQAGLLAEFRETVTTRGSVLSDEATARRLVLSHRAAELNRRGRHG
jgi:hypothetical protein